MTVAASLPYSWLRQEIRELQSLNHIPLWGVPPALPLTKIAEQLGKAFQLQNVGISTEPMQWMPATALVEGLGQDPFVVRLALSPLNGNGYLLIPQSALQLLIHLSIQTPPLSGTLLEEFVQFVALEAALAFNQAKWDAGLALQIVDFPALQPENCLGADCTLSIGEQKIPFRILIDTRLNQSIREKYTPKTLAYPPGIAETVTLDLHLIAGKVQLSKANWIEVAPGDCLILDSCSLRPDEDKGRVILTVLDVPLFRGKLKDGTIKILEYPLLQEASTPMANEGNENDFEASSEEGEEELEEQETEEEEEEEEETDEKDEDTEADIPIPEKLIPEKPIPEKPTKMPETKKTTPFTSPEEIPLTISIEVGRVRLPVQTILQLQPGNTINLDVHPEDGVDLMVNGKCIAKGELIKLGELLAVRILDK